jgi:PAS domain S-box-containing protein
MECPNALASDAPELGSLPQSALAEQRLRESEERYRAFIANSTEGIWRYELDTPLDLSLPADEQIKHAYRHGRLAELNDAMARMYGYARAEDLIDTPLAQTLPPEDEAARAYLQRAVQARFHFQGLESVERDRTGRIRHFENSMVPIIENGKLVRVWGVQRDVTKRKLAEQALEHSRARYATLVENLRDYAIFLLDPNGIITEWTPGAERVQGYRPEEVIGQHVSLLYTPEQIASGEPRKELDEAAREGRAERELWQVRKDGELIWVNEVATAIHDGSGTFLGFTKISRDLTERKRISNALRESEQRRLVAVEAAGIGDWRMDPSTRLLECSPRAGQMHGLEGAAVITLEEHQRLMHPDDRPVVAAAVESALDPKGEGRYRSEFRFVFPDEVRWFESVGRAFFELRGGTRHATHIVGAMIDITERKAAEEKLREADRRKDEFLATLAHELRNPLAPLKNGVQIARRAIKADSPLHRTMAMMDRQLNHLVHLVNDLLDVARINSGKLMLRSEPVLISEVLAHSTEASQALIDARDQRLIVEKAEGELCVEGDFDRLAQIFANLLSNAAKYTEVGGEILVVLAREGTDVVIRVSDTGIGIPAEDLPHVFDLFSQVRVHQGRAEGGLGIGLALVRSLVSFHRGSIRADSEGPGKGSTFTVRLPSCRNERAEENNINPRSAQASTTRCRVLIADDNEDAASSLATLLQLEGHEVATARDGLEAVEKARDFRPDLALLDLGMPRLDGIEAAKSLRALPGGAHLRIVALTGCGQQADRQRTREAGFDAHLVKPIDSAALSAMLSMPRSESATVTQH